MEKTMSSFFGKVKEKKIKITIVLIVVVLLALYVGLSIFFMDHFYLHSTVNGVGSSFTSEETVKNRIAKASENYSLTITDEDKSKEYEIKAEEIGIETSLDNGDIKGFLDSQNGFAWPYYMVVGKEYVSEKVVTYNEGKLREKLAELPPVTASGVTESQDAAPEFNGTEFIVKQEVYGNNVDLDELTQTVGKKIESLQRNIGFRADKLYVQPKVTADSKELNALVDELNKHVKMSLVYTVGDEKEVVPSETIASWLNFDENYEMSFNEDEMANFVASMATKYNTAGKEKTLHTSWDVDVTVPGGNYGWKIDNEAELEQLKADVLAGEDVSRDFVYSQTANSRGENDYGNSYIEVNISAQHLYLYVDGQAVFDTDVVTGNLAHNTGTHVGAYRIAYCEKNATLRGDDYVSHVGFWMPFHGGEGLHDATWRGTFGGQIYRTSGSHGCVNLPYSAAKTIFGYVKAGYPVLVYNLPGTENSRGSEGGVTTCINAINGIGEVTGASGEAISTARSIYNALSDDMKAQVTNYDVLCNAEATYASIMAQAQAQADAQAAADAAAAEAAAQAAANGQE